MNTELPTTKQELERKTVDFMERIAHQTDTGQMRKSDFAMLARALWHITSGLVGNGISELCAMAAETAMPPPMKRHFVGKGKVMSFIWNPNANGYVIVTLDPASLERTLAKRPTEVGLREAEMKKMFDALLRTGYVEI